MKDLRRIKRARFQESVVHFLDPFSMLLICSGSRSTVFWKIWKLWKLGRRLGEDCARISMCDRRDDL